MTTKVPVLVSAAERSGDEHAAKLVREVLKRRPDIEFHGFGGEMLAAAGCHIHMDLVGLSSIAFRFLGHIHRYVEVVRTFDRLLREIRPVAVVLVDSPGLNFVFARLARWRGVPVAYYICPQIWAWGPWRRRKVLKYTDLLLTILPFEERFYENSRVPVKFVGHPLADDLEDFSPQAGARLRERLGCAADDKVIGILPGSRAHEVEELMPIFRRVIERMDLRGASCRVMVSCFKPEFEPTIRNALDGLGLPFDIVAEDSRALACASDFLLVASGTASLQAAYFEKPMVVLYRATFSGYLFLHYIVVPPFFSLPNILGGSLFDGEPIVPERLCRGGEEDELARVSTDLLHDGPVRQKTLERLRKVREAYLQPGANARAAAALVDFIDTVEAAQPTAPSAS